MRDDRSSILEGFLAYRQDGLTRARALYEARMDYEVRGRQRTPDQPQPQWERDLIADRHLVPRLYGV